jgi:hypothetical protein
MVDCVPAAHYWYTFPYNDMGLIQHITPRCMRLHLLLTMVVSVHHDGNKRDQTETSSSQVHECLKTNTRDPHRLEHVINIGKTAHPILLDPFQQVL